MKMFRGCIISLIVFFMLPVTMVFSFGGPLQVKNLYPIFLHANQPYIEKAGIENSVSLSMSHSSTYTVQQSAEWTINLDMEITELSLRYKKIIFDQIELGLDMPVLIIGGGFLDRPLEGYHDGFGFSDYGRSNRPHGSFLYEVRRNGNLVVKGHSGVRLGDVRIAIKKPLISKDTYTLSIRGDLELPVSKAETGFSNGSIDGGIALLFDKSFSDRISTYLNLGAVFPGDLSAYENIDLKNFLYAGGAVEAIVSEGLSVILQLQGQTAIYPETDLLMVDREAYLIALGGRYKKGQNSFDLSLTEDLNTAGAPDFIINLTYKMEM